LACARGLGEFADPSGVFPEIQKNHLVSVNNMVSLFSTIRKSRIVPLWTQKKPLPGGAEKGL